MDSASTTARPHITIWIFPYLSTPWTRLRFCTEPAPRCTERTHSAAWSIFLPPRPPRPRCAFAPEGAALARNEESLLAALARRRWSGRLTANRNFSTGFMADRDYRNEDASLESWSVPGWASRTCCLPPATAPSAPTSFMGPITHGSGPRDGLPPARQELGSRTVAAFGYRRHTDEFVLLRDDPVRL